MSKTDSDIKILPMSSDHLAAVADIETSVFPDPWSAASFLEAMSFSDKCWVAVAGNRVAGYLVTQWVMDEIHILNIAVAKDMQRRGIARQLLEMLLDSGKRCGIAEIFLEVRKSNHPAQALYHAFGFTALTTRKRYYRDGEDALIMHCPLVTDDYPSEDLSPSAESSDITR
ncbi:MAG: ribosomal protein S18-alanine N-acetyltransferase [Calditrichota bacterium]